MTQINRHIKIFESNLNFYNSSSYEIIEKFVKPYVTSLRKVKQKYGITESNIRGNVPTHIIELIEKLSKVKIVINNEQCR